MSIVKTYSVFCDGAEAPGHPCPQWYGEIAAHEAGVYGSVPRALRRQARGRGWAGRRRDGRLEDLCPKCAAEGGEQS